MITSVKPFRHDGSLPAGMAWVAIHLPWGALHPAEEYDEQNRLTRVSTLVDSFAVGETMFEGGENKQILKIEKMISHPRHPMYEITLD